MVGEPIKPSRSKSTYLPQWARAGARILRRQIPGWRRVVFYDKLGAEGRLGNQLWQIAGTLGLAQRHNADAAFNPWPYEEKFSMPKRYFPPGELEGHPAWMLATDISEPFRVYLQDPSLWIDIEAKVRAYFSPPLSLKAALAAKFADVLGLPNKTAVHVRRTDYLAHPEAFRVLGEEYYRQAVAHIGESNILVFSDDADWCREHLGYLRSAAIITGNEDYEDFFIMTQCEHHVAANSSFSWWGAFLSEDRHPVVPRAWYGPAFLAGGIDETRLFLPGWTVIDA